MAREWLDRRNPLASTSLDEVPKPRSMTESQLELEQARKARRTIGLIQNRSETFVIDPELEVMRVGAATGPLTGVGIWLGLDDPDYEFRIGNPGGDYMHWDGSTLTISSASVPSDFSDLTGTVNLDTQVSGTLSTSFAEAGLINSGVTINADGTLSGAGGGQASLTSLPGSVQIGSIAANAVTSGTIAALAVTAGKIAANAVTATEINVASLSAISADMGSLTAGSIVIGTTNRIWLNDSSDGALNIGGATKASAPFRVTSAGALTATSATITGTITSTSTIAASSFTGTSPTFDDTLAVEGGDGDTRVLLDALSSGGRISLYYDPAGAPANQVLGTLTAFENVGWDEIKLESLDRLRLVSSNTEDITLEPSRDVDFQTATTTGRSATSDYMRIRINGTVRYLLLYS